jgi:uncharacterized repeat protein (TIGR03803 family)
VDAGTATSTLDWTTIRKAKMKNSVLWQDVVSVASWRAVSISLALLVVLGLGAVTAQSAQAQTFTVLHDFTAAPNAGLVMDAKGNLYGTTYNGGGTACGGTGCGTVFKVDPTTGKDTVLHSFTGHADGAHPNAGLIIDGKGNLYGPTAGSGADGYGTVFKVSGNGKFAVLYSFSGPDEAGPGTDLIFDAKTGNLYGTSTGGGADSYGTVFKVDPTTGEDTVLHSFTGHPDGAHPNAGLIMDGRGNLYGTTTTGGGADGHGTMFKLAP